MLEKSLPLMKRKNIRYLLSWIATVLTLCVACNQTVAKEPPINAVRTTLTEKLNAEAANSSLKESLLTSTDVRSIVHENLDPGLLNELREGTGTDFSFISSSQNDESHVTILILTYSADKTADQMAERLGKIGGYFRHSKILTPFSYVASGEQVVIAFTENAGNEFVVKFINELPGILKRK